MEVEAGRGTWYSEVDLEKTYFTWGVLVLFVANRRQAKAKVFIAEGYTRPLQGSNVAKRMGNLRINPIETRNQPEPGLDSWFAPVCQTR